MTGDAIFALFPIITFLFYIAPVVFIIWFLLKFLKIQQEKNRILKNISDKLDKPN
ncbi:MULTISPECIES: hypothetical protein [Metabacillus]|uniref:DUF4083 domain-containing protein n=1 Tax=Metabacillus elymi TaxID=2745198 RepID=A0ABX6S722_9BACI|nr:MULTISPECIES: hypothetical protein [Metabacillus]QNF29894.1 hypothetical protein HUW50_21830 [Metabacillus sp. KUDC1714]